MFKHRYLTVRISPTRRGFQLHPNWGDCLEPSDCICTDGCSACSGDCSACGTATCKGPDSAGAIVVDPAGKVEMVLDLKGLQAVLAKVGKAEKAAGARKRKRR